MGNGPISDFLFPISALQQFHDLPRLRMSLRLGFLEDRGAVAVHFKAPAPRRNHLDLGVRERAADLGRQTDGPWLVVSDLTELDRDLHRRLRGLAGWKLTRRQRHADVGGEATDDGVLSRDDGA